MPGRSHRAAVQSLECAAEGSAATAACHLHLGCHTSSKMWGLSKAQLAANQPAALQARPHSCSGRDPRHMCFQCDSHCDWHHVYPSTEVADIDGNMQDMRSECQQLKARYEHLR